MSKKNHKIYRFTLVLKGVEEDTPGLEDAIFEVGCDDALINFRSRTVYLDFDRETSSFKEAILSAIKQVESASLKPKVISIAPENFVTESEIAKRLGSKRQTVSLWIKGERRKENPFPKPVMKLSAKSPLWKWREVVEWLYQNKIIEDQEKVDSAILIEDLNAALEERNLTTRKHRTRLLSEINNH